MDKTTEERAHACYIVHRGACEDWTHGEPAGIQMELYGIIYSH